jgi:Flp pilus assembly protein TadD
MSRTILSSIVLPASVPISVLLLIFVAGLAFGQGTRANGLADASGYVGNDACAKCHAAIVESYSRTAMARSSGTATSEFISGEFHHQKSGVNYRIAREEGGAWLTFDRPGDSEVHGRRQLLYYIGEGRRGRTYLFMVDGDLFEAPVNWYGDRKLWDMTPAYSNAREIPMNLPALPSCLECHASGFKPPIGGSENHYPMPAIAFSGVTCERCHGPGAAHVNSGGAIVNPAKLPAARRDAVCMQCHLEGDAAIERAGKHLYQYRAGDDLSEFIRYYVLTDSRGKALRANSQFEALTQSVCKKKSGDAMSCLSCHDPHRTVQPEERVGFYRAKCLNCHGESFGAKHHVDHPDCTSCHMPSSLSSDVAHTEVTNHAIPRRATGTPAAKDVAGQSNEPKLVAFPDNSKASNDERELALAWESIVNSGMTVAEQEAERRLKVAAKSPDAAVLSALGYIEQKHGALEAASKSYRDALTLSPGLIDVENNLGAIEARAGQVREAVTLWEDAFQKAPGRSGIGMNLAREFCAAGKFDVARDFTMRVLQFNPDLGTAKRLLRSLNSSPPKCVE